jgi:hypothetical protein
LADGSAFLVELEIDDEGNFVGALHRPHHCDALALKRAELSWLNGKRLAEKEANERFNAWVAGGGVSCG